MALTDWVQTAAVIYFAWQQNHIFKQQNQIIANQSERTAVPSEASRLRFVVRYWPTLAMIAVMLLTGYDIYDRHHPGFGYDPTRAWDISKPLENVYNAHYINQAVLLDGKHFIGCSFDNVTLVYQGKGGYVLENSQFSKRNGELTSRLASSNRIVTSAMSLSAQMDALNGCKTGV